MGLAKKLAHAQQFDNDMQTPSAPPLDEPMFPMNPSVVPPPSSNTVDNQQVPPPSSNTDDTANQQVPPPPSYYPPAPIYPSAAPHPVAHVYNFRPLIEQKEDRTRLDAVIERVVSIDWSSLSAKWRVPLELMLDFAQLALYDIAVLVDDSGSMIFCEDGTRIEDLVMILTKISEVVTMFDSDGIVVRFLNSNLEGNGITNEADVNALVKSVKFSGQTMLGTCLKKKILDPFTSDGMNKPILVITITDGDPAGEVRLWMSSFFYIQPRDCLAHTIEDCVDKMSRTQYGAKSIAFQFVQVGKDAGARRFLDEIDNLPSVRGGVRVGDVIDVVSYYEDEEQQFLAKGVELTVELYLLKLCLGAIDATYDVCDGTVVVVMR